MSGGDAKQGRALLIRQSLKGDNVGMDRKDNRARFREPSDSLPFRSEVPAHIRDVTGLLILAAWLKQVARDEPWYCGIAAIRIGTESQSPRLYSRVLPSLRENYKYDEEAIKHFWLHSEVDIEHSNRGFEILDRHCTTPEMKEAAIHFARESARMRWFYFDGIYLHYEQGYQLQ